MTEKNQITEWMESGKDFVLYRLPQQSSIHTLLANRTTAVHTFAELRSGCFVFAPFAVDKHPILLFEECTEINYEQPIVARTDNRKEIDGKVNDDYRKSFEAFHHSLTQNRFSKLVLSRSQVIETEQKNLIDLFHQVCCTYPNSMVYLYRSTDSGTWLGASPELLLEGNSTQMHTVALAGTMTADAAPRLSDWSKKNIEEQMIVADYMRDSIRMVGDLKDEWGPYSSPAGHLAHLKTDFYFRLSSDRLSEAIGLLHPTPAVCGLPKQDALQFIQENEAHDRSYYAGFLGWYDPDNTTRLFVNLRCMKWIDETHVKLYAGGGILSASNLETEWLETENKLQTLCVHL